MRERTRRVGAGEREVDADLDHLVGGLSAAAPAEAGRGGDAGGNLECGTTCQHALSLPCCSRVAAPAAERDT